MNSGNSNACPADCCVVLGSLAAIYLAHSTSADTKESNVAQYLVYGLGAAALLISTGTHLAHHMKQGVSRGLLAPLGFTFVAASLAAIQVAYEKVKDDTDKAQ